jgi:AraC-like DNA-binding protein
MPARRHVARWREAFAREFLRLDIEPLDPERFQADATIRFLPGLKIGSCAIAASRWRRTRLMINPASEEFGLMFGTVGPALLSQRGRSFELGVGDAGTCLHSEPADLTLPCASGRHVGLIVPIKKLGALVPDLEARMPCRIPRESEPLRLLTGYIGLLADEEALATPELCGAIVTHVHDLIALAIGATRDGSEVAARRGLRAARLRAVKADIAANLASRELSVVVISKRQGITPRYLHMLFEAEGTSFSRFVLAQRLGLARRMLADPGHDRQAIAEIAYDAGFGDLSYFNRAFRRRFGMTPSEVRMHPVGTARPRRGGLS